MPEPRAWSFDGFDGPRAARTWDNPRARYIAVLCHGYGEHVGRYGYVADALVRHGAVVYAADHVGHGSSAGERVLIRDYEEVVADFDHLVRHARQERPGLPVALIGHSMGGMIAARYAQVYPDRLDALVLSGPVLGRWDGVFALLGQDPIPDVPIDPDTLSRDPKVGQDYLADPLVWHGPFRRPTLEALFRCLATIGEGPTTGSLPTLWLHGADDQLVPRDGTLDGIRKLRGEDFHEKSYPRARHEIFNETNRAEVLGDVTGFLDRALADVTPRS